MIKFIASSRVLINLEYGIYAITGVVNHAVCIVIELPHTRARARTHLHTR